MKIDINFPQILKLIVIENSHVRSGGRVVSLEHMKSIFELSQKYDVSIHLDGARVFNAAMLLGVQWPRLHLFQIRSLLI